MQVTILSETFDPWSIMADYQRGLMQISGQYGATDVFVGTMRDFNEDENVKEMHLEHYPGMTEKHLERIGQQAIGEYQLLDCLIVHRVGTILPNEAIVLIAVWSAHRKQAFEACREIMEDLKSKAPFWKKEQLDDGQSRWVKKNTAGY